MVDSTTRVPPTPREGSTQEASAQRAPFRKGSPGSHGSREDLRGSYRGQHSARSEGSTGYTARSFDDIGDEYGASSGARGNRRNNINNNNRQASRSNSSHASPHPSARAHAHSVSPVKTATDVTAVPPSQPRVSPRGMAAFSTALQAAAMDPGRTRPAAAMDPGRTRPAAVPTPPSKPLQCSLSPSNPLPPAIHPRSPSPTLQPPFVPARTPSPQTAPMAPKVLRQVTKSPANPPNNLPRQRSPSPSGGSTGSRDLVTLPKDQVTPPRSGQSSGSGSGTTQPDSFPTVPQPPVTHVESSNMWAVHLEQGAQNLESILAPLVQAIVSQLPPAPLKKLPPLPWGAQEAIQAMIDLVDDRIPMSMSHGISGAQAALRWALNNSDCVTDDQAVAGQTAFQTLLKDLHKVLSTPASLLRTGDTNYLNYLDQKVLPELESAIKYADFMVSEVLEAQSLYGKSAPAAGSGGACGEGVSDAAEGVATLQLIA